MPVRMRLSRFGCTHRPFYRIVATDSRRSREGMPLEYLGTYDPLGGRDGIKEVRLQTDRVKYWIGEGAELTDTVSRLLSEAGLLPRAPARLHTVKCKPKEKGKAAGGGAPAKAAVSAKAAAPAAKAKAKGYHTDARAWAVGPAADSDAR